MTYRQAAQSMETKNAITTEDWYPNRLLESSGRRGRFTAVSVSVFFLLNHAGWNLFLQKILEDGSNLTVLMRMNLRTKLGADNKSTVSIYCSDELMPTPRKTRHFPNEVLLRIGHHALAARSRNHRVTWVRILIKAIKHCRKHLRLIPRLIPY